MYNFVSLEDGRVVGRVVGKRQPPGMVRASGEVGLGYRIGQGNTFFYKASQDEHGNWIDTDERGGFIVGGAYE